MIDYTPLAMRWQDGDLSLWADTLLDDIKRDFHAGRHGDLPRWLDALDALPDLEPSHIDLTADTVSVGLSADASDGERKQLEAALRHLHPWRKGPFQVFGVHIDTEWRSDWKWNRLAGQIQPLHGRRVLDVGCGSGYHCWRMLGTGAREVIGIDPTPLFVMQFWALQKYIQDWRTWVLPLGIERLPPRLAAFDTVFSMGLLHHRRSPIDHLTELQGCLVPGGELVLETLVVEGGPEHCLVPGSPPDSGDHSKAAAGQPQIRQAAKGRYAGMGNVWILPSCDMLRGWLEDLGFADVRLVDVSVTTTGEQRSTDWMQFHSLREFLDPKDSSLTIEGHPAPRRAMFIASKR